MDFCKLIPLQFEDSDKIIARTDNKFLRFDYWRIIFAFPVLISIIQMFLMFTVYNYESPKFYKENNRNAELNQVMGKIYTPDQVKQRIDDINVVANQDGEANKVTIMQTLTDPRYKKATLIGVSLSAMQQLSGINLVLFYGGNVFSAVISLGNWVQVIIGLVNFIPCIPAYYLIQYLGRKTILTWGSFICMASLIPCGIFLLQSFDDPKAHPTAANLSLIFLCIYISAFAASLGPLCWTYMTEVMTEKALSIGVAVNLILTVAASVLAPVLFSSMKGWVFIMCAGFTFVTFIFCFFVLKETKGLNARQIQQLFSQVEIEDENNGERSPLYKRATNEDN